jgi:hypothetical protein
MGDGKQRGAGEITATGTVEHQRVSPGTTPGFLATPLSASLLGDAFPTRQVVRVAPGFLSTLGSQVGLHQTP